MPVCKRCNQYTACLTIDPCDHCGVVDWIYDQKTGTRPTVERGNNYAEPLVGKLFSIVYALFLIGVVILGLWGLVALVHWMWNHS